MTPAISVHQAIARGWPTSRIMRELGVTYEAVMVGRDELAAAVKVDLEEERLIVAAHVADAAERRRAEARRATAVASALIAEMALSGLRHRAPWRHLRSVS